MDKVIGMVGFKNMVMNESMLCEWIPKPKERAMHDISVKKPLEDRSIYDASDHFESYEGNNHRLELSEIQVCFAGAHAHIFAKNKSAVSISWRK